MCRENPEKALFSLAKANTGWMFDPIDLNWIALSSLGLGESITKLDKVFLMIF